MAQIKKEDIKQLSTEELKARIIEEKENITKLYFNHTISPVDNPLTLRDARKNIARLKTEDRARDILAAPEALDAKDASPEAAVAPKASAPVKASADKEAEPKKDTEKSAEKETKTETQKDK